MYNTNMDPELEPEMELTIYDLRWDIDGTGVRDGVGPQKYNTNMDLEMELTPPHNLMWNIIGTGGGDGVDPQKVQPKY